MRSYSQEPSGIGGALEAKSKVFGDVSAWGPLKEYYEQWSKLLVPPLINPYITPFK